MAPGRPAIQRLASASISAPAKAYQLLASAAAVEPAEKSQPHSEASLPSAYSTFPITTLTPAARMAATVAAGSAQ